MSPALAAPDSISDAYNRVYAQASRSEHSEAATRHLAEYHQAKATIERDKAQAACAELQHEARVLGASINGAIGTIDSLNARIAELERDKERLENTRKELEQFKQFIKSYDSGAKNSHIFRGVMEICGRFDAAMKGWEYV